MQYSEREYITNKIVSGYTICSFNNETVLVSEPSPFDKLQAHNIFLKEYKKAVLLSMPTEDEILKQMMLRGLWNPMLQTELDQMPKAQEELKVALYNAYFQFKQRDNIKKALDSLRHREVELIQLRDKLKHVTCEGFALASKNKHLICSSSKRVDGSKFFIRDYDDYPQHSLELFMQDYFSQRVDDETIREISQHEPWKSIWGAGKHESGVFGVASSLLTQEQRLLIIWSKVYDSIHESPDCPPEEVLLDNDCLDGWMIVQSRKRENERKSEHGYKPGDKFNKADEVFIVVENPEDAGRVAAMNSPAAIFRKQQRMNALERAGGKIEEQYMPDSQNTMREQLMQMQKDRLRRG